MQNYKHYIRLDENKNIVKAFSDAFEQPEHGDICVNENGGRHFNFELRTIKGYYTHKYDKKIIKKTQEEIDSDKIPKLKDEKKAERKEYYKQIIIEDLFNRSPLLSDYTKEVIEIDKLVTIKEIQEYKNG